MGRRASHVALLAAMASLASVLFVSAGDAQREAARREVTIGASGDLLAHLKVIRAAEAHAAEGGFAHVLGALGELTRQSDLSFINLETPLSQRISPETGDPPVLGAPPTIARALADVGVDVVSVANNHAYDQGADGLSETLDALAEAGVGAAGAHAERERAPGPWLAERSGARIALLAYTERINRGPASREPPVVAARADDDAIAEALEAARAEADLVILSIHWSHDFYPRPSHAQRRRAARWVESGADLILGHGPHVLQEVERVRSPRGEALVAYSLGNLVSNQGLRFVRGRTPPASLHPAVHLPTLRDGVWLRARFRLRGDRVELTGVEGVPLFTHNNFLDVARRRADRLDIRVGRLGELDPELAAERRSAIAEALGDAVTLLP